MDKGFYPLICKKMNRFNLGLHQALFLENWREASSDLLKPIDIELKSEVIIPTQKELKPLKSSLTQVEQKVQDAMSEYDSKYFNFVNDIGTEIKRLRTERGTLRSEDFDKVKMRHRDSLEWNKRIRDWYENSGSGNELCPAQYWAWT